VEIQIDKTTTGYAQKYFWRIVASNGQKLATSEMCTNKADARSAAESVKANAGAAKIVDKTVASASRW
jgi:uncharacterized protein YegP (UPF0339 family)